MSVEICKLQEDYVSHSSEGPWYYKGDEVRFIEYNGKNHQEVLNLWERYGIEGTYKDKILTLTIDFIDGGEGPYVVRKGMFPAIITGEWLKATVLHRHPRLILKLRKSRKKE